MSTADSELPERSLEQAETAYRMIRRAAKIAPAAARILTRILFPASRSHMRFIPPDIRLEPRSGGAWTLFRDGTQLANTLPLIEIVNPINRPVVIVASGPSAKDFPLASLRDGTRFIIAVNGSATLLAAHGVKPDLIVVIDDQFCRSGAHHFEAAQGVPLVIEMIAGAVWAQEHPQDLATRKIALMERVNSWYGIRKQSFAELKILNAQLGNPWWFPEVPDRKFRVGWSDKPEYGFFSGRTVTYAALQVAIRLGAREIEIVGMDLGGNSRAYQEDNAARPSYLDEHYLPYILPSFQLMGEALRDRGIRITNRSPVCPLPGSIFS